MLFFPKTARFAPLLGLFLSACSSPAERNAGSTESQTGEQLDPPTLGSLEPSTNDAGTVAASVAESGAPAWPVAPHPSAPQVQHNPAGSVLATPVLVAVTFPGYDLASDAESLVDTIGSTSYWTAAVGGYGVGPARALPPVRLSEAAPATTSDAEIQSWLASKLTSGSELPAATPSTVYVLFYPSSVSIAAFGRSSCTGYDGYHQSMRVNGADVEYAVIPECAFPGSPPLLTMTSATSHEIAEAATDPRPEATPPDAVTWQQVDAAHAIWELYLGGDGEIGDMCSRFPSSYIVPAGYPYAVQRLWSNTAALAGHDPCQPVPPTEAVYFNAAPVLPDLVTILSGSGGVTTSGVHIPVGEARTIEIDLFSDGPVGQWNVGAADLSSAANLLTFTWLDGISGTNGDRLHLQIQVSGTDPTYGGDAFQITSQLGSTLEYWFGFIGTSGSGEGEDAGDPGPVANFTTSLSPETP